jgi:protein transport protein SEC61 subunit alpha
MIYVGHRDSSMLTILKHYIPVAALLGGVSIALLTIVADLFGALGSGSGILMAVSIIYSLYETLKREME